MSVNLKGLFEKLNNTTRSAFEAAASLCVSRTNYDVEVEHYLVKLLDQTNTDFQRILDRFGVDKSRLESELARSLDSLKRGNARTPAFSPKLIDMIKDAWSTGSLDFGEGEIRSGLTVLALTTNDGLVRMMQGVSREWQRVDGADLRKNFREIIAGSVEDNGVAGDAPLAAGAGPKKAGKTPGLDQYTIDLTQRATEGKIDPVLGRDEEIRQIIDILMRRRQNNPILTGEAGVGKTAVVEGFALRVAKGDVPPAVKGVVVRTLDLTLLQAGAGVKGEFENRLKNLIEEVKASPVPIILFIDEAHTMIGAGGQAGQGDAANILKPALARGEVKTIAATTWAEYKKYFEKDAALSRRFQVVKVDEPDEERCMVMMRGIIPTLEKHHKVHILHESVQAAVRLSNRYIAGRQLPDKAISVLDTACARLSLGQNSIPSALESAERQLIDFNVQERILRREEATGSDHAEVLTELLQKREKLLEQKDELERRWQKETEIVSKIRELREVLASDHAWEEDEESDKPKPTEEQKKKAREQIGGLNDELIRIQGETPMIGVCVDGQLVGEVISNWTGIPVGKMMRDEYQTVLDLPKLLGERVIGQSHALESIGQRIVTSRANLDDPNRPIGVFLLVGPSGVGKTESALALSDLLYGGERNLITINMSEFQEAHTVSTLKGSPPGYIGYGEGGVLTEAVRRRPFSVVLLDEVEKAHPDVLELFYQAFDKGHMEDGEGRDIDFKNTIIILTTNACTDTLMKLCADPETMPTAEGLAKALKPELNKIFKAAFLGRMVIVPYYPIFEEPLRQIISLKLRKIQRMMELNHRIPLTYGDELLHEVARRCTEIESGARNIDNILTNTMLPEISRRLLSRLAAGEKPTSFHVTVSAEGSFVYE